MQTAFDEIPALQPLIYVVRFGKLSFVKILTILCRNHTICIAPCQALPAYPSGRRQLLGTYIFTKLHLQIYKLLWYAAQVKIGDKTHIGCCKLLRKTCKVKRKQTVQHFLIFPPCNFPVDFRVLLRLATGYVLCHQAYQHLPLKFFCKRLSTSMLFLVCIGSIK